MLKNKSKLKPLTKKLNRWVVSHYFNLAVFNMFLILMFLLRSAGYFHPFLVISVNLIIMASLVASIFLFGARSKAMFSIVILFWLFVGFLRIIEIEVWAERTSIYAYQALVLGVLLLLGESISLVRGPCS